MLPKIDFCELETNAILGAFKENTVSILQKILPVLASQ
jgi:hypothetical protein